MGGGGDVVGALGSARLCQSFGAEFVLGGVAWERWPVDPHPGPRSLAEIIDARPLSRTTALAGPGTTTPLGGRFAESGMAEFLGSETVLVDITGGPPAVAAGLREAAAILGCDLIVLVDVGGDVLAHGGEPGLASPLCDAVILAAGLELAAELPVVCGVAGAGCDGELTPAEVDGLVAALARGGALLGSWGLTPALCEEIEAACQIVPTEASALGVRCARGERGTVEIRSGRRTVELSAAGALTHYFDPMAAAAAGEVPLAGAVREAGSLSEARDALAALGIRTELDLEEARARGELPPY
ncbi:MAG: DUF1152 domain-containing protein [Solirubrobacterales bacterium]